MELCNERLYGEHDLNRNKQYLCRKLRISDAEFEDLVHRPTHHYTGSCDWDRRHRRMKAAQSWVSRIAGRSI